MIRPDSRVAALLTDLGTAVQEIRRLRWTRQPITLTDDAPTITDQQLRHRLITLAECARR